LSLLALAKMTPSMLTQIYEVSTPKEARSISEIGVDHIGVLIGNGEFPRELPVEAAARVAAAFIPPSKFSALFLNCRLNADRAMGARTQTGDRPTWARHRNCLAWRTRRH
jgi:hypothetical protein